MYEEARGNRTAAMRDYEEAARNSGDWAGPLFNLALLHERQHDYAAALRAIERAMQRDDTPPYQTLKLRISKRLHAGQQNRSVADRIVADFGNPEDLDEWELGWYIAAADLANNKPAGDSARNIRRQRGKGIGAADRCGKPPAIRGKET
jgi:tetratricopeptide (TPR) repeat protein